MGQILSFLPIAKSQTDENFNIISCVSEEALPSTAEDGDIAIITATSIEDVYIQGTEPSEIKTGDLWITFTATGSYPITSNSVIIYPKIAKQYNGSEWIKVPMFVFNNTEWNSTVLILLDKTNTADEITGGWATFKYSSATVEKTADGYKITGQNGGYQKGAIQTVNKVDVTDYNKLVVKGSVIQHNTYGAPLFGLMDHVGQTQYDFESGFLAHATTSITSGEYTATLDISSYSGEYYITALTGDILVVSYIGLEE